MTFDDILDQVITLLKRQGRVSYPALKRRFDLDDAYLEDLKGEILFAHPVVDEERRGLVWTGESESAQAVASQPAQTHTACCPGTALPRGSSLLHLLTRRGTTATDRAVLRCGGLHRLAGQLDPEDWRNLVREYQRVCSEVIQRYDGHIAQLLGDGLLVYFGYPQAHEDDAQRCCPYRVRNSRGGRSPQYSLEQDKGITLAVRLGIHTGLVVVGAMGGGGRQEQLALGETPNVAARIQGLAAPNTLVISAAT